MSESSSSKPSSSEKFVPVLSILVIVLVFVVGVMWQKITRLEKDGVKGATNQQAQVQATEEPVDLETIKGLFDKDLIKFGDSSRKLLVVEVSDPSCPYCSIAAGKNSELNTQAGDQFKLVADGGSYIAPVPEFKKLLDEEKASYIYIYYPGHGNGEMGAKALYCAYEDGKYWQVHDLLMSSKGYSLLNDEIKNDKTKSAQLAQFLSSVFDEGKMKDCLDSGKYDDRITSDTQLATSLGINGTPSFYINTTNFPGAYGYDQMEPVVEEALK